jgi:hypothetical protein
VLRTIDGTADAIPAALRALADANDEASADRAYWTLDNRVVVQGQLFQSALAVAQVVLAMLLGPLSRPARRKAVDLLLQIGGGVPDQTEVTAGNAVLGQRCRDILQAATWKIYELVLDEDRRVREAALELVTHIDPDQDRLVLLLRAVANNDSDLSGFARDLLDEVEAR